MKTSLIPLKIQDRIAKHTLECIVDVTIAEQNLDKIAL